MIKLFKIEYESWWEASLEVDAAVALPLMREYDQHMRDLNPEGDSEADWVTAYLRHIAPTLVELSMRHGTADIIQKMPRLELLPLDGTSGLKLLTCDSYSFEGEDFDVREKLTYG